MFDFQGLVDGMGAMTCVVSVEKKADGSIGEFRIVTGNKSYVSSIEHPMGYEMLTSKFIPNSIYTKYFTRDLNFETFCYGAAVQKKCLHSYAHPDRMNVWFNMTFLPVAYEEENLCFCTYTMEVNLEANSKRLSSSVSEDIAAAVLETCITLRGANDFQKAMESVIVGIREMCDAEHCCVFLMDTYEKKCSVLCEALSDHTKLVSMTNYLDENFYGIAESWEGTIAGSNCLVAKDERDMEVVRERNPIWHKSLTDAGAHTIVLFPLRSGEELLGYIWAINFDAENAIKIKETLELTTFVLGSEIANQLLLDRLKILSSKDLLTGVLNRNEMNNCVDRIVGHDTIRTDHTGVVFADLNGLKVVNDQSGHAAGDTLLKNAAKALLEVFREDEVYRAGGDEFTMIIMNTTQEELDRRVDAVRKAAEKYPDLVFALGSCMAEEGKDIHQALKIADERMYVDKNRYYEMHPEKKRARIL